MWSRAWFPFLLLAAPVRGSGEIAASLRHAEGDVQVASSEAGYEREPGAGSPLEPGDQLSTFDGRAEVVLADGSQVWLDRDTRLDLVSLDASPLLRLWRGTLAVRLREVPERDRAGGLRVDTQAGTTYLLRAGRYRVDAERDGLVVVSVEAGLADVGGRGSSVLVRPGQRASVFPGEDPESPYRYNTAARDDLARYLAEREEADLQILRQRPAEVTLYEPILPYEPELIRHGSWRWSAPLYTWVWVPRVSAGWRPYYHGRWLRYRSGLTWVSSEPWGFVTYHYGAWDYAPGFGWFWVPGHRYSPGWVDWYVYDDYVAWCPRRSYHYYDHRGRARHVRPDVVHEPITRFSDPRAVVVVPRSRLASPVPEARVPVEQVTRLAQPVPRERLTPADLPELASRARRTRPQVVGRPDAPSPAQPSGKVPARTDSSGVDPGPARATRGLPVRVPSAPAAEPGDPPAKSSPRTPAFRVPDAPAPRPAPERALSDQDRGTRTIRPSLPREAPARPREADEGPRVTLPEYLHKVLRGDRGASATRPPAVREPPAAPPQVRDTAPPPAPPPSRAEPRESDSKPPASTTRPPREGRPRGR